MQEEGLLDCIIKGGSVVLRDRVQLADIAIKGGLITQIASDIQASSKHTIDAKGLYAMAGVVDTHVHLNGPGREEGEGFQSDSSALAAGGCTTFLDMTYPGMPATVNAEAMSRKLEAARASGTLMDYGLWAGLTPDNLDELAALADQGAIGFKAYMSSPEVAGVESFRAVDDVALYEGMRLIAELKKVLAVHAESEEIIAALTEKSLRRGATELRDYAAARPMAAELDAVRRALLFAERTDCPLHLAHLSNPQAVDMAWEARRNGLDVTVATCPHYLLFTDEEAARLGAKAKCAPPIRGAREREGLWARLAEGKIDLVASAHSPCPPSLKEGDGFTAREGIAGGQSLLELIFDEGFLRRGLPLPLLSRVLSEAPARRFGLFPRKGRLAPGADADIVLVHPDAPYVLRPEHLLYRHRQSAYEGRLIRCRVALTMSRGRTVYSAEGGADASGGGGQWLPALSGTKSRRLAR
ncbi:allantoinase AllB [Cohnella boryungensis]|uniref:Allantoinase AllB n=1 Tax=Cohnella boryungensis TaxID=768479 RepID=A0ABV8S738_9BACL